MPWISKYLMNHQVTYTYLITFKPTGQYYYGSRTQKGCHPSELGTGYLSSSKTIKSMIKQFGISQFIFEVRKTFTDKQSALSWERRFLDRVDAARNPKFLNKHNAGTGFVGGPKTEETKEKLRIARKRQSPIPVTDEMKAKRLATRLEKNGGTYHSKEAIAKMKAAKAANPSPGMTGKPITEEAKEKQRQSMRGKNTAPWSEERKLARSILMKQKFAK